MKGQSEPTLYTKKGNLCALVVAVTAMCGGAQDWSVYLIGCTSASRVNDSWNVLKILATETPPEQRKWSEMAALGGNFRGTGSTMAEICFIEWKRFLPLGWQFMRLCSK